MNIRPRIFERTTAFVYTITLFVINLIRLLEICCFLSIHPFKTSLWKVPFAAGVALVGVLGLRSEWFLVAPPLWFLQLVIFWCVYAATVYLLRLDADDLVVVRALQRKFFRGRIR